MFMHILQEAWLPYWLCWLVMFLPDNKMLHSVVFYISRLNHSRIAICWFGNVKRAKQESVEQHCKSGQMEKKKPILMILTSTNQTASHEKNLFLKITFPWFKTEIAPCLIKPTSVLISSGGTAKICTNLNIRSVRSLTEVFYRKLSDSQSVTLQAIQSVNKVVSQTTFHSI